MVTSNYVLLKDGRKIFCKLPILATNSGPLDLLKNLIYLLLKMVAY